MLIGLSGQANVGKDTVADILVHQYGFIQMALADELKRTAKRWYGFTDEELWGPSEFRNKQQERYPHLIPREVLQKLGTEVGRSISSNTWVDYTLNAAEKVLAQSTPARSVFYDYDREEGLFSTSVPLGDKPKGIVISDVRFQNEITAIRLFSTAPTRLVRIVRPSEGLRGEAGKHASEQEQLGISDSAFDLVLDNRGTLKELEDRVNAMMGFFSKTK